MEALYIMNIRKKEVTMTILLFINQYFSTSQQTVHKRMYICVRCFGKRILSTNAFKA